MLVLDEPTRHLDLWARDSLERSLVDTDATALFVSHDRYVLDQVADHRLVTCDGNFHVVHGNYDSLEASRGLHSTSVTPPLVQSVHRGGREVRHCRVNRENVGFRTARPISWKPTSRPVRHASSNCSTCGRLPRGRPGWCADQGHTPGTRVAKTVAGDTFRALGKSNRTAWMTVATIYSSPTANGTPNRPQSPAARPQPMAEPARTPARLAILRCHQTWPL